MTNKNSLAAQGCAPTPMESIDTGLNEKSTGALQRSAASIRGATADVLQSGDDSEIDISLYGKYFEDLQFTASMGDDNTQKALKYLNDTSLTILDLSDFMLYCSEEVQQIVWDRILNVPVNNTQLIELLSVAKNGIDSEDDNIVDNENDSQAPLTFRKQGIALKARVETELSKRNLTPSEQAKWDSMTALFNSEGR